MIHLVQMPFGSVERPSLALGLLKASLHGLAVEVTYANLAYAERIGLDLYRTVELTRSEELVGEWVFSRAAFRAEARPDEPFLRSLRARLAPLSSTLSRLRADAPEFVREVAARVMGSRPRIVGVSSTFQQHCASLALLRAVKELDPGVVTVIGGANCEASMGRAVVRNFPWVDYAVSGEADELFPRFCQELLTGPPQPAEGLFHREWDTPAESRATVASLEELPRPDFDDYFRTLDGACFADRIEPGLVVETSRGCWWGAKHHCTFCGLNGGGMGYRSKSAPRVLEELDELSVRYGVKRFQMADNILAMAHLKTLLPELPEKGYSLFYETKANLRRAHVETLARAGVRWIQPGIESLHDAILDLMDKGATALVNVQLLRHAREFGVRLSWNFLSCFPGEDPSWSAEMCEWLPRVFHLQPPSANVRVRYDRFSPYHNRPEKYGLELEPYPNYAHVYPLPAAELRDLAYFFDDADPSGRSMERPEYRRLNGLVGEWRAAWEGLPPLLTLADDGQKVEIYDSRPGAVERFYALEGPLREALLACDTPSSGLPPEVLEELDRRRLVLVQNGKALSLAVPGNVPTLPDLGDYPGGNPAAHSWSRQYQGGRV